MNVGPTAGLRHELRCNIVELALTEPRSRIVDAIWDHFGVQEFSGLQSPGYMHLGHVSINPEHLSTRIFSAQTVSEQSQMIVHYLLQKGSGELLENWSISFFRSNTNVIRYLLFWKHALTYDCHLHQSRPASATMWHHVRCNDVRTTAKIPWLIGTLIPVNHATSAGQTTEGDRLQRIVAWALIGR